MKNRIMKDKAKKILKKLTQSMKRKVQTTIMTMVTKDNSNLLLIVLTSSVV